MMPLVPDTIVARLFPYDAARSDEVRDRARGRHRRHQFRACRFHRWLGNRPASYKPRRDAEDRHDTQESHNDLSIQLTGNMPQEGQETRVYSRRWA
jgi:hypothetical protein